jgi:serine/threonine-protein kinase HipA
MRSLVVYLHDQRLGILAQDDSGLVSFRYEQDWHRQPHAVPLSRSLPLQGEAFEGKKARPFFAGILPEEGPRRRIAAILGISERNDFALLERIGGECAGAVSLVPETAPPPLLGELNIHVLNDRELEDIVIELPRCPLLAGKTDLRLSLAGAQDKLPVVIKDSRFALPLGNTASSHIIKPEPDHFPGLATNELICMTLAKQIGLDVPSIEYRLIGNKPCVIVQRFDRITAPGGFLTRLHQEDFCQALGFPPEKKYQQEGGPLLRDCIALLRDWSTTPVLDILRFIDGLIFNVLIGNADAHGKNYSLLYDRGERRIAPFYDLVCTVAWPELSTTPAMKIGASDTIHNITPAHWQKMAKETNLGWPMIRERLNALSRKTLDALQNLSLQHPSLDQNMIQTVTETIIRRATLMSKT